MLNRVVLVGRLTRDPVLRRTASNTAVASFAIAVDDSYRSANGERNTLFMDCSMFGTRAENVVKFTHKGSLIAVEGRLSQRKYTRRDGVEVTVVETIADNVEFLDPKSANAGAPIAEPAGYQADAPTQNDAGDDMDSIDLMSDDLPF